MLDPDNYVGGKGEHHLGYTRVVVHEKLVGRLLTRI